MVFLCHCVALISKVSTPFQLLCHDVTLQSQLCNCQSIFHSLIFCFGRIFSMRSEIAEDERIMRTVDFNFTLVCL